MKIKQCGICQQHHAREHCPYCGAIEVKAGNKTFYIDIVGARLMQRVISRPYAREFSEFTSR